MAVIENLTDEEAALYAIITDPAGIDLFEFAVHVPSEEATDGCWRARSYQWSWYRCTDEFQIDSAGRSVGKTLSIELRACAFPFRYPGREMLITAPELNLQEPITDLIKTRFEMTRLLREMLPKGRSTGTRRPFLLNFENGARIMGQIPGFDGHSVKGKHPLKLEIEEAQEYPHGGWVELINTLRSEPDAGLRCHGVTNGVRNDFWKRTQDPNWTKHYIYGMHSPEWSDARREHYIREYGSREDPDYRRNILGQPGDTTMRLFVTSRMMKNAWDENAESFYSGQEYSRVRITSEMIDDVGGNIEALLDEAVPHPNAKYKVFWSGADIGFVVDPTEILVFAETLLDADEIEYRKANKKNMPNKDTPYLRLLARIVLVRVSEGHQARAIEWTYRHFKGMKAFSMDATGAGVGLYQRMQEENYSVSKAIRGFKFGSKIAIGIDDNIELDEYDDPTDAAIMDYAEVYATNILRKMFDQSQIWMPCDTDMMKAFQGATEIASKNFHEYGKKKIYSKGDGSHVIDAARMAVLGWKQNFMDAVIENMTDTDPVFDLPVYGGSNDYDLDQW